MEFRMQLSTGEQALELMKESGLIKDSCLYMEDIGVEVERVKDDDHADDVDVGVHMLSSGARFWGHRTFGSMLAWLKRTASPHADQM